MVGRRLDLGDTFIARDSYNQPEYRRSPRLGLSETKDTENLFESSSLSFALKEMKFFFRFLGWWERIVSLSHRCRRDSLSRLMDAPGRERQKGKKEEC